jgi:O-antigen/teichoic acid export membrane protein
MAWLAGGVLLLQGPIVVLGMVSSPAVIATYSTTRTLTRLGVAGMNLFNFSLMPEYSSLFGAGQFPQWRRTLKLHALIAAVCILGYLLFMALFGGLLMDLWMNGNIRTTEPLFGLLIAAVAAEMVWSAAFTPIAATNRHVEVSYVFAILAIFAVAAIYLFASAMGIEGVAACVLTAHVLMAAVTLFALRHRVK